MRAPLTATVVTPAPPKARSGNRITALRWAKRLRELGWRVRLVEAWSGEPTDALIALHAARSHRSVARHAAMHPAQPRVVALTGTDIYADVLEPDTLASIDLATRLVVLQPEALRRLPERARPKARVIRQSARAPAGRIRLAPEGAIQVAVIGHFRAVKDPLLAADAVALLPDSSRVHVFHLGEAPEDGWRDRVERASVATRGRWTWLGSRPRDQALAVLAGSDVALLTSLNEGGANVVTEALACGVPVLSTRIEGSIGILGPDYPGYFPIGDADMLAQLFARCENDEGFLASLRARARALRPITDPSHERAAWGELLAELARDGHLPLAR